MEKKKVGFASGIGFILAAAGSAVGLGNLWGFPYKTSQNGGAAFVLIYVACVLLIGFVTMLSEIYLGRRAQANPMTAYKMIHKNLGWCGLVAIVIPAFIICYYSVLGGWTTKYALNSFSGNAGIVGTFSVNTGEVILYTAIFLVLSMMIIMGGVKDGIEKASKVLMPVLFLILVAIAVYALTLGSGVREGLSFYLKPDFSGITFKSVLVAMGQAFYSLSLGMGIMITYGSYTGKEVNLVRSTAMICIFDTLVALIAGLAIFPSVAHFDPALLGSSKGVALMFIILPQVFESMGGVGQVVSFAFFVMVDIAAITSVVSLIEVVTQFVIQKFHAHRKRAALIVAGVCFLVSIPIGISLGHVAILEEASPALFGLDWLTFFDEVTNTVLMPVCALFSCIVVGWFITPRRAVAEIEAGGTPMAGWLKKVYAVMIRFVTPALILIVEIGGLQSEIAAGNVASSSLPTRLWRCAWWRISSSSATETPARTPTRSSPAITPCDTRDAPNTPALLSDFLSLRQRQKATRFLTSCTPVWFFDHTGVFCMTNSLKIEQLSVEIPAKNRYNNNVSQSDKHS